MAPNSPACSFIHASMAGSGFAAVLKADTPVYEYEPGTWGRLFYNDSGALRFVRFTQSFHYQPEQHWRDSEIVRRPSGRAQRFPDGFESRRVLVVPIYVAQQTDQLVEGRAINAAMFLQTVFGPHETGRWSSRTWQPRPPAH